MSNYFTPTDSTVTGAQFCYNKTFTEHDSNQPAMQMSLCGVQVHQSRLTSQSLMP